MTRFDIWLAGAWITSMAMTVCYSRDPGEPNRNAFARSFLGLLACTALWPLVMCWIVGAMIRVFVLRWRARNLRA